VYRKSATSIVKSTVNTVTRDSIKRMNEEED
jgi:hypothetical protein